MDQFWNYISDILNTPFLSDFGAHIFVCVLLGFGFLTYFLSIKPQQPTFESHKNVKKRVTKEKIIRNKNDIDVPPKPEFANISHNTKLPADDLVTEVLSTENDDNEYWIPVQKLKKMSKNEKQSTNKLLEQSSSQVIIETLTKSNIHIDNTTKSKPKSKHNRKQNEKQTVTDVIKEVAVPNPTVVPNQKIEIENKPESKPVEIDNSESPTNSSTDDFVFVSSCKTSSDNDAEQERTDDNVDERGDISATSGASRKKTKKQQKTISKHLLEAAVIAGGEREESNEEWSAPTSARKSDNVKKRRPRKDN